MRHKETHQRSIKKKMTPAPSINHSIAPTVSPTH